MIVERIRAKLHSHGCILEAAGGHINTVMATKQRRLGDKQDWSVAISQSFASTLSACLASYDVLTLHPHIHPTCNAAHMGLKASLQSLEFKFCCHNTGRKTTQWLHATLNCGMRQPSQEACIDAILPCDCYVYPGPHI